MAEKTNNFKDNTTCEINQKPTINELIERFATVVGISFEEAEHLVGAATEEKVLNNIEEYTKRKIYEKMPKLNRQQRRALAKRTRNKQLIAANAITDTAEKLNYIDLIQKLRELNAKKEMENKEYDNNIKDD